MDAVIRALAVYLFLLLVFRLSGTRSLAQITAFDFVLLLIISEATQQALLGDDFSVTNSFIVVLTLVAIDRTADHFSWRLPRLGRLVNGGPVVLIDRGEVLQSRLDMLRITPEEILERARTSQGLENLGQIRYAVLERNGSISVIPD